jgi:hypothetical protein
MLKSNQIIAFPDSKLEQLASIRGRLQTVAFIGKLKNLNIDFYRADNSKKRDIKGLRKNLA